MKPRIILRNMRRFSQITEGRRRKKNRERGIGGNTLVIEMQFEHPNNKEVSFEASNFMAQYPEYGATGSFSQVKLNFLNIYQISFS